MEAETNRLKKMYANMTLELRAMKDLLGKLLGRLTAVGGGRVPLPPVWSLSISCACGLVDLARSARYRRGAAEKQAQADAPVIDALNDIIEDHGRWGFWKCFDTLRNRGHR